jgi:hypothetical protein
MRRKGYGPIYYMWYHSEHTFIFTTSKEATMGYELFEQKKKKFQAWWYGLDDIPDDMDRDKWYLLL